MTADLVLLQNNNRKMTRKSSYPVVNEQNFKIRLHQGETVAGTADKKINKIQVS